MFVASRPRKVCLELRLLELSELGSPAVALSRHALIVGIPNPVQSKLKSRHLGSFAASRRRDAIVLGIARTNFQHPEQSSTPSSPPSGIAFALVYRSGKTCGQRLAVKLARASCLFQKLLCDCSRFADPFSRKVN